MVYIFSGLVLAAALLGVASSETTEEASRIAQVSFNDLIDSDARDVTVTDDGKCFVYTSEATYQYDETNGLESDDWRIWKTCDVFSPTPTNELVSDITQPVSTDYTFSSASSDRVCYSSYRIDGTEKEYGIFLSDLRSGTIQQLTSSFDSRRKSSYCDISADGRAIVFESEEADLVNIDGYPEIFLTVDDGITLKSLTPPNLRNNSISKKAQVSGDGSYVSFNSKYFNAGDTPTSATASEAWLYRASDEQLHRVTNFAGSECNQTLMFDLLIEEWGLENLTFEGITLDSRGNGQKQCEMFASKGKISGAGTIDVGDTFSRISDDGRFITYAAAFDAATIHATKEEPQVVSRRNIFLFDTHLGITWKITKEGMLSFCLFVKPKRHMHEKKDYLGCCCWQNPCGHPAVSNDLSGDGSSIVFMTDGYPNKNEVKMDYEIYHYHVPTNELTIITDTSDTKYDDSFPSVSSDGSVTAWTSDFDYSANVSATSTNQIFAAKLDMGCSRNHIASNYMENPDLEVCCEWEGDILVPASPSEEFSAVMRFEGDALKMMKQVAFATSANSEEKMRFCLQYAKDVRKDVACGLGIPLDIVEIEELDAGDCGSWEDNGIEITVSFKVSHPSFPNPNGLVDLLMEQYHDSSSPLWNGYLTKTLRESKGVSISVINVVFNGKGNPSNPLGLCEGDCDNNNDCDGDLICYQREKNVAVPGCDGGEGDNSRTDYCIHDTGAPSRFPATSTPTGTPTLAPSRSPATSTPTGTPTLAPSRSPATSTPTGTPTLAPSRFPATSTPTGTPTFFSVPTAPPKINVVFNGKGNPSNPLGLCEGDCDNNNDCDGDLICYQREKNVAVPGCYGGEGDNSRTDYCIHDTGAPSRS